MKTSLSLKYSSEQHLSLNGILVVLVIRVGDPELVIRNLIGDPKTGCLVIRVGDPQSHW